VSTAVLSFLVFSLYLLLDRDRLVDTFTFSVKVVYGFRPHLAPRSGASLFEVARTFVATRTFGTTPRPRCAGAAGSRWRS
jgi:hypothetical protein